MMTAIATWGNSAAIRLPKSLLNRLNLKSGDEVSLEVNDRGNLEVVPVPSPHRRVMPSQALTADALFKGYTGGRRNSSEAWPNDDMTGAEYTAWSR